MFLEILSECWEEICLITAVFSGTNTQFFGIYAQVIWGIYSRYLKYLLDYEMKTEDRYINWVLQNSFWYRLFTFEISLGFWNNDSCWSCMLYFTLLNRFENGMVPWDMEAREMRWGTIIRSINDQTAISGKPIKRRVFYSMLSDMWPVKSSKFR